jgi:flagella basal body P-ring formation protein FlgA
MWSVVNCPAFHPLPGLRIACAAGAALLALNSPVAAQSVAQAAAQAAPARVAAAQGAAASAPQVSDSPLSDALRAEVQRMAHAAALTLWGERTPQPRVEVVVGALPAHLKLAPCAQVQPYLPSGSRPLGRSRIGLRCEQGAAHWNVSLPVTVRLWAPSLVASGALPTGTVLEARHLATAEVDLAERADPAIGSSAAAIGRTLQRSLAAGDPVRQADLKTRQLFATGDTVRIVAVGAGYAVSSEGQAMGPGLEGQNARVRTDSGRIITGVVTAERRVELPL